MNNTHKQTPMTHIDNLFSPGHGLAYEDKHQKTQSVPEKQPYALRRATSSPRQVIRRLIEAMATPSAAVAQQPAARPRV